MGKCMLLHVIPSENFPKSTQHAKPVHSLTQWASLTMLKDKKHYRINREILTLVLKGTP